MICLLGRLSEFPWPSNDGNGIAFGIVLRRRGRVNPRPTAPLAVLAADSCQGLAEKVAGGLLGESCFAEASRRNCVASASSREMVRFMIIVSNSRGVLQPTIPLSMSALPSVKGADHRVHAVAVAGGSFPHRLFFFFQHGSGWFGCKLHRRRNMIPGKDIGKRVHRLPWVAGVAVWLQGETGALYPNLISSKAISSCGSWVSRAPTAARALPWLALPANSPGGTRSLST